MTIARAFAATLAGLMLVAAAPPPVKVDGGAVRGREDGDALIFRGIPFAAPPVGPRRWTAPGPVQPWRGIRDASAPAPACIQNDQGWNHADFVSADEDCLTLDIRTPGLSGRKPVFVWIHGGSNRAGSPGDMVMSRFGRGEIVLVAVRYRLGIFGFLSHRGLSAEAGGSSGNYGIMDQIAALEWVKRNIARFGGDPDRVTIGGESAGSQDVGLLLAAPAARALFAGAVMESGTPGFGLPWRSREEAERIGDQADALLQTGGDAARLRSASVPALLQADLRLHDEVLEADDYLWLRTTIDGRVFSRAPRAHLEEGPGKRLIIGSNRFELGLPGGRAHRDAFVARAFGANEAKARAYYTLDLPDPAPDPRMGTRDDQIATDITFRCPAGAMASLMAAKGAPVWRYEFDLAPGGGRTSHSAELGYIFGEQRLSPAVSIADYWSRFVVSGDPNADGLPSWPRFESKDKTYVSFEAAGVVPGRSLREDVCGLTDRL